MPSAVGLRFIFATLVLVVTSFSACGGAMAQTLSEEQLRILSSLSEEQRMELARTLGLGAAQGNMAEVPEFPDLLVPIEDDVQKRDRTEGRIRLQPGDTVIVQFERHDVADLGATELRRQEDAFRRNSSLAEVEGASTYEISPQGEIEFRGLTKIYVAGLTPSQAARRIEAEPLLRHFSVHVMYLPLAPLGADGLVVFGQDLFQGTPVTFAPATDVPVPPDYVLGPGDTLIVQLFGKQNDQYRLAVTRDGSVNFPGLGPIVLAGLSFDVARALITERVTEKMIGVSASVTMGELRSIRVFVLGDVSRPGSFTVGGLSTITNALFVSGGVSSVGSLRHVQLKRSGKVVTRLDLYDLLLRGDNSGDARLQPNDVIFVPPRGGIVAVGGEVQRPAIYELAGEGSLAEVIELAGGFSPVAFPPMIRLERVESQGGRVIRSLDLSVLRDADFPVRNGDVIEVGVIVDRLLSHVMLEGRVLRPGPYEWREGMRLTDLLPSFGMLAEGADRRYILIQRRSEHSGPLEVFSADLERSLAEPESNANPMLQDLDRVMVFELGLGRTAIMDAIIDTLRTQAEFGRPSMEVAAGGMVRVPGTYPLERGMRASDLIRAGGGLAHSAYGLAAEITRYDVAQGTRREVEVINVDLAALLSGDASHDIFLQPFDFLNIQRISQWRDQANVELHGEVTFPGTYPIRTGETLVELLERAGGLTSQAFPQGSVFLRLDLKEREQAEIDRLVMRMERDLASLAMQAARADAVNAQAGGRSDLSVSMGETILQQLRSARATGRLAIDLPGLLDGVVHADIRLKHGDQLYVPEITQEVTVIGEVQHSMSHMYSPGLERDHYVRASGGLTVNADTNRIYIVRANGSVVGSGSDHKWFRRGNLQDVRPGDTIVVPMDIDRVPALALWQSSTTILFNIAIAVAAIGGL